MNTSKKRKCNGTLLTVLSDTHSGGDTALFPNRMLEWGDEKRRNHTPNSLQLKIYGVFMNGAEYAREHNPGRLVLVHDGDATEATHHDTQEVHTLYMKDHVDTHVTLMNDFIGKSGHAKNKGDKLYYTIGTESHTQNVEYDIAEELQADGIYHVLKLEMHGIMVWCTHHGKQRGFGPNKGNALRNWLRDIYFDCRSRGERPPDLVITGHTHAHWYGSFVYDLHTVHGIICPSLQAKTRYAHGKVPVEVNEVGVTFIHITEEGDIRKPVFLLTETDNPEVVKI